MGTGICFCESKEPCNGKGISKQQESTTLEFGSIGNLEQIYWSAAVYRSEVDDELISVVSDFAVNGSTSNYQAGTIHQGLELELRGNLTRELFSNDDSIDAKLVYNYSDFYFDGGSYSGNQIAGVPKHLAQFELQYKTDSGLLLLTSNGNQATHLSTMLTVSSKTLTTSSRCNWLIKLLTT